MIKLEGTVETVIFYNSANGYAVCDVSCIGELGNFVQDFVLDVLNSSIIR